MKRLLELWLRNKLKPMNSQDKRQNNRLLKRLLDKLLLPKRLDKRRKTD